jgi:hypothetical protein
MRLHNNNFDALTGLLDFPTPDTFYFLQIIKRRKENPDMTTGEKVVKNYYINSRNDLDKLRPRIIERCVFENARAYIRLNKRSHKKHALHMLKRIADLIMSEQYIPLQNVYDSVAGEFHNDPIKKWIIDLDNDNPKIDEIRIFCQDRTLLEVPTVNGSHLIVLPFDSREFGNKWGGDLIHKDNPTILYTELKI